jgi:LPS-assembly lipoprotein
MWWCDGQARGLAGRFGGRMAGLVLTVAAAFAGGCADGFRPMYAQVGDAPAVAQKMAAVDIAPIPSRVGQRIRNELVFQNTGGGEPAPPKYRLEIVIRESVGTTLVKTTGEAASQIYNLEASFRLIDLGSKKVMLQGNSYARAGFDRFSSIYSNVRAREDAENRTARTIADDLKIRLAAFLSNDRI